MHELGNRNLPFDKSRDVKLRLTLKQINSEDILLGESNVICSLLKIKVPNI